MISTVLWWWALVVICNYSKAPSRPFAMGARRSLDGNGDIPTRPTRCVCTATKVMASCVDCDLVRQFTQVLLMSDWQIVSLLHVLNYLPIFAWVLTLWKLCRMNRTNTGQTSKRIRKVSYLKYIDKILDACPHFSSWSFVGKKKKKCGRKG